MADMMAEKLSTGASDSAAPRAGGAQRGSGPTPSSEEQQQQQQQQIRWYGIAALPGRSLLEDICRLDLPAEVTERVGAGRPEYHVTLWHVDGGVGGGAAANADDSESSEGVRAELAASVGQEAVVEVVTVDWSDSIVAAQVR